MISASAPLVYAGTSPACELVVEDPLVSRRHLSLSLEGTALRVRDLRSKNGTFANGLEVADVLLRGGEHLTIGNVGLAVEVLATDAPAPLSPSTSFGRLLGRSVAMRRLYPKLDKLAASEVPFIIEGETGTGKELLAECVHELSSRASGPFVVLDSASASGLAMEAQLCGCEPGAVPGFAGGPGALERASGGTLLIDEISELDLPLQAKLLRALESRATTRVGAQRPTPCHPRIIVTTRRDLEREIQDGRLRDDLYYRLAVTRVDVPPLRVREGDIQLLAESFWASLKGDPPGPPEDFLRALERMPWPGNVSELYNVIAERITMGQLASAWRSSPRTAPSTATTLPTTGGDFLDEVIAEDLAFPGAREKVLDEFTRRYLRHMLARHNGNISAAAAAAGIGRRYFYMLKESAGLEAVPTRRPR